MRMRMVKDDGSGDGQSWKVWATSWNAFWSSFETNQALVLSPYIAVKHLRFCSMIKWTVMSLVRFYFATINQNYVSNESY